MSFDVFLQRFEAGSVSQADAQLLARLLAPYLAEDQPGLPRLRFSDGDAAIYGLKDLGPGFMVNHVSGERAWDLLADIARQAALTIMPVGCPVAVADEHLLDELPDELRDGAVVIASGRQLLDLIRSA
jgi:hypothetical protein